MLIFQGTPHNPLMDNETDGEHLCSLFICNDSFWPNNARTSSQGLERLCTMKGSRLYRAGYWAVYQLFNKKQNEHSLTEFVLLVINSTVFLKEAENGSCDVGCIISQTCCCGFRSSVRLEWGKHIHILSLYYFLYLCKVGLTRNSS